MRHLNIFCDCIFLGTHNWNFFFSVLLTPNYNLNEVVLVQTGPNQSTANGKILTYHDEVILKHADTFEVSI